MQFLENPLPVNICGTERFLKALLDPACEPQLNVCRYHHRKGSFGSGEFKLHEHLIVFVESGSLLASLNGTPIRVHAGGLMWAPPGTVRGIYGAAGRTSVRQYNLRFIVKSGQRQLSPLKSFLQSESAWELQPLFQMLYDLHEHGHRHAENRLRSLLSLISTTLLNQTNASTGGLRVLSARQRLQIGKYVADHAAEPITPGDLANEIQLSLDYFTRLFRATFGLAPRGYLKRERMRMAALRLRESNFAVKQIAREVGAGNVALFCRQFRDVIGCTPSAYRRRESLAPIGRVN